MDIKISILTVESAAGIHGIQMWLASKLRQTEKLNRPTWLFGRFWFANCWMVLYEILGGEHRWRAAIEHGHGSRSVTSVGVIDDNTAKQMSLVDNTSATGEDDAVELQRLIESIPG